MTAVALDENGNEISRNSLKTAGDKTVLTVQPEKSAAEVGEVCFFRIKYTDEKGIVKPLERGIVDVTVMGGELLAVGCACPYNEIGFSSGRTDTYYGEALAVVRATSKSMTVTATDGKMTASANL